MAALYCMGIPLGSLWVLHKKRNKIQKLYVLSESVKDWKSGGETWRSVVASDGSEQKNRQDSILTLHVAGNLQRDDNEKLPTTGEQLSKFLETMMENDPLLTGIAPLYRDYEVEYWWFEIPKFVATLVICGLVTLIPAEGASQVFISMVVSTGMMVLFANCNPHVNASDDFLAQFCQLSLTFAMAVGILEMAADSFQVVTGMLYRFTADNLFLSCQFYKFRMRFSGHCWSSQRPQT